MTKNVMPLNSFKNNESLGEFRKRGAAAIERTVRLGNGIPAEDVIRSLEAKVEAARARQKTAKDQRNT